MLRTFRNISIAVTGLLLGACASHLSYSEMKVMMPVQGADKGRIYFYREASWLGNSITPDIAINTETVGASNPGTFFFVDRTPGDYQVLCGKGEHNGASFSLAAGQEVYVRTAVGDTILKSTMVTEVVPTTAAIPAIHGLKYDSQ